MTTKTDGKRRDALQGRAGGRSGGNVLAGRHDDCAAAGGRGNVLAGGRDNCAAAGGRGCGDVLAGGSGDHASVVERKRVLRAKYRQVRCDLGAQTRETIDSGIEAQVLALPEFGEAEVILSYLNVGPEVRTRGIIEAAWAAKKVVALPWCVPGTREMRWYRVTSFDGLVRSRLGVEEPVPREEDEQALLTGQRMLALVPALSFDPAGYRLGYGGGFFDTFLLAFDGVSVGLCREAQLSADLRAAGVVEAHDLPVQAVVTERRVLG